MEETHTFTRTTYQLLITMLLVAMSTIAFDCYLARDPSEEMFDVF